MKESFYRTNLPRDKLDMVFSEHSDKTFKTLQYRCDGDAIAYLNCEKTNPIGSFASPHVHERAISCTSESDGSIEFENDFIGKDSLHSTNLHDSLYISDSDSSTLMDIEEESIIGSAQSFETEIDAFLESIPKSLKNKISFDEWGQIFDAVTCANSTSTKSIDRDNLDLDDFFPRKLSLDDDDTSVISEISHGSEWKRCDRDICDNEEKARDNEWNVNCNFESTPCRCMKGCSDSKSIKSDSCIDPLHNDTILTKAQLPKSTKSLPLPERYKRVVSFDSVQVRCYNRIMDNNPACTSGVPIGLGWYFRDEKSVSIDNWEKKKGRRSQNQLRIPRNIREEMLLDLGFRKKYLVETMRCVRKAKHQRKQTVNNLGASGMEEAMEKIARRLKRVLHIMGNQTQTV